MLSKNKNLIKLSVHIIMIACIVGLSGCSKTIKPNELQMRGNIAYRVNSKKPFTGIIKSGKDVAGFKKGLPHGKMRTSYSNGQIEMVGTYKNGKENGIFKYYHSNGQLMSQVLMKKGMAEGKVNQYTEEGQLSVEKQ